jgi:hypothetical protein
MSHASIPHEGKVDPLDPSLIRLSIGIEDVNDLIDDLGQAFDVAARIESLEELRRFYKGPRKKVETQTTPFAEEELDENLLFDSEFHDLPLLPAVPSRKGKKDSENS